MRGLASPVKLLHDLADRYLRLFGSLGRLGRSDRIGLWQHDRQDLDFLEVFNARMTFSRDNRLAREMAARWGLPGSAGSDAHAPSEVGRAYVDMAAFDSPQEFLDNLASGQIGGRLSSPVVHVYSSYAKLRQRQEAR